MSTRENDWNLLTFMCKIRNEEGEIEQRNVVQQSGVFYDLLPKGGEIDLDTVEVFADNTVLRDSLYDIETINNYQDSGRTLLIIKIKRSTDALTKIEGAGGFVTSKVTDMAYMFYYCHNLQELDVSTWDTSKVTSMESMFYNCNNLKELDVSTWDTSSVTNMAYMFYNCNKLTELEPIKGWNTSNVTTMSSMFYYCTSLKNIDLSPWNTSAVLNMDSMFANCTSLESLDISGWSTLWLQQCQSMFYFCNKLITIFVSDCWDLTNATSHYSMFYYCNNIIGQNNTTYNNSYTDKTRAVIDTD